MSSRGILCLCRRCENSLRYTTEYESTRSKQVDYEALVEVVEAARINPGIARGIIVVLVYSGVQHPASKFETAATENEILPNRSTVLVSRQAYVARRYGPGAPVRGVTAISAWFISTDAVGKTFVSTDHHEGNAGVRPGIVSVAAFVHALMHGRITPQCRGRCGNVTARNKRRLGVLRRFIRRRTATLPR